MSWAPGSGFSPGCQSPQTLTCHVRFDLHGGDYCLRASEASFIFFFFSLPLFCRDTSERQGGPVNYYYFCFYEMSIKPFFNARLTSLGNPTALFPLFLHFPRIRSVVLLPRGALSATPAAAEQEDFWICALAARPKAVHACVGGLAYDC